LQIQSKIYVNSRVVQSFPDLASPTQAFHTNSAVVLRNVFNNEWLEKIAQGVHKNLEKPSQFHEFLGPHGSRFFNDYCNWRQIEEYADYVHNSPAAAVAAQLMRGQQAIFYHEHVLIKEPQAERETPWHHDQPYYPADGPLCSMWMPLEPVSVEASLKFVKGSHAWGRWFTPRKFATLKNYEMDSINNGSIQFETIPDLDSDPDIEVLSWAVEPGDVVCFHGLTLHSAAGNPHASRNRTAFATRWFNEKTVCTSRPWELSPPFTGGLAAGDGMECDLFPVVWPPSSKKS